MKFAVAFWSVYALLMSAPAAAQNADPLSPEYRAGALTADLAFTAGYCDYDLPDWRWFQTRGDLLRVFPVTGEQLDNLFSEGLAAYADLPREEQRQLNPIVCDEELRRLRRDLFELLTERNREQDHEASREGSGGNG